MTTRASAGTTVDDWGDVDDYQNQQVMRRPVCSVSVHGDGVATVNRPRRCPRLLLAPMSSPITQAARPPLNPGPWMI